MVELTQGIFNAAKNVYSSNRGSILRTIVYTIGHFAIARGLHRMNWEVGELVSGTSCSPPVVCRFVLGAASMRPMHRDELLQLLQHSTQDPPGTK